MAKIIKISKERVGDYPMFPRTEYKGLKADEGEQPQEQDFTATRREVDGMGEVWTIECNRSPRRNFQVIRAESTEQFDDYLARLRSMHETPAYIEGRLDFMVLFIGSRESVEINQLNYKQVDAEIVSTLHLACRWWNKFGVKNEE